MLLLFVIAFVMGFRVSTEHYLNKGYGATRTPHVFLLEKTASGNRVKYIGTIDDNYQDASQVDETFVENAVDAMLAGHEINPKTTKAIGCGIK